MKKNRYFSLALIVAFAILSGCRSTPQNSNLSAAHANYSSALSNPQVTNLAAPELKDAGDSLNKADAALSKGEKTATVDHLAYIANQKVAIAQETAKRKTAELAVTEASAKRDKIRLEARTAEADAAKQQSTAVQEAAKQQAAAAQETAEQQAAALAAAGAKSERDQATIAQQEAMLKELNAKKTERGMVITLGDVLFSVNKAQLKSGGTRNVKKLADFLTQNPQQKVSIEGHTDSTGSNSLNQKLSERRANAVKAALIKMGISSDRITTRGYGEEFPVASNDSAVNRQMNRRVEIILSDENGNIAPR
ncbi:MAG TPA: OmpA family protein [Gallionellaceae bacterium]|nr:OmpA family protein [Gallionellaceae bacterium]